LESGWRTTICVLGPDEGAVSAEGEDVVFLNAGGGGLKAELLRIRRLRRLIKSLSPDVVHSHLWPAALAVGLSGLVGQPPHVVHIRDTPPAFQAPFFRPRARKLLMSAVLKAHRTAFIAVSHDAASYASRHLAIPADQIQVVLNGVSVSCWPVERRSRPLCSDGWTFGMAGRLDRTKSQETAIQALAALVKEGWPVRLKIAGVGSAAHDLRARAASLGVAGRVLLLGEVRDMPQFYESIDVLLHTSLEAEGLPRVLMEGALAGVPVVTFPCAGAREAIPSPEYGWVIERPDWAALAQAMRSVMRDRERICSVVDVAQRRARNVFDVRRVAREVQELYSRLLGDSAQQTS
jgi:glycosyltransferase involved in cell wall biosynthesis